MATVRDLSDLLAATAAFTGDERGGTLFRGQGNRAWPLVPKAGRADFAGGDWRERFSEWCWRARAVGPLPSNYWKRLALAHHHGLAGPLLDWSTSPLVAAFFAVTGPPGRRADGVVYRFEPVVEFDPTTRDGRAAGELILAQPLPVSRRRPFPALLVPPFDHRLRAQQAAFSYHADPTLSMSDLHWPHEHAVDGSSERLIESLDAFRIPARCKAGIARQLEKCGVHRERLFPDPDRFAPRAARRRAKSAGSGRAPELAS